MAQAGYSGTPLAKKLGFKPGEPLWASGMPASVKKVLDKEAGPRYLARPAKVLAAAHVFHTNAAKLEAELTGLRGKLAPDGMIWPMGYVDVKVCAVDETWSGLKLVIRKALR